MYDEEDPGFFDTEFVKTFAESIIDNAVAEETSDTILTHLKRILQLTLTAAKDNRVACGRAEICIEDMRIAAKDVVNGSFLEYEMEKKIMTKKRLPNGEFLSKATKMRALADVTVRSHWLVVDGVPSLDDEDEDFDDFERHEVNRKPGPLLMKEATRKMPKTEKVEVRTSVIHASTLEQQLFFKEIMEAIMGTDETRRTEALYCLQIDPGLHVLIPRFSNAVAEGVRCNLIQDNIAFLLYLMKIIDSFVRNNNVNVENYLHELIPPIISCLVVRSPRMDAGRNSLSWVLREFCAELLYKIIQRCEIPQLEDRLVKVFANVFTRPDPYLPALYGVAYAINLFGKEAVTKIFLPNLEALKNAINSSRPIINKKKLDQKYISAEGLILLPGLKNDIQSLLKIDKNVK